MAVRSRDFVGIAEGIRSHELSTKSQIENLKGRMSELSGRRSSLNSTISYLEAAIAAAYEDTDEDGDPDYGLIASLEAQKSSTENELSGVETCAQQCAKQCRKHSSGSCGERGADEYVVKARRKAGDRNRESKEAHKHHA